MQKQVNKAADTDFDTDARGRFGVGAGFTNNFRTGQICDINPPRLYPLNYGDAFDLDADIFWQTGDLDAGAGGGCGFVEIAGVNCIHSSEIVHIC